MEPKIYFPTTSKTVKYFNYTLTMHDLCHEKKINTIGIFKDLTNQSALETEFIIAVQFNYLGLKVHTVGRGPSPKDARMMACKQALIRIAHHSRLSEPKFALSTCGLTEDDLTAYCKSIKCPIHSPTNLTTQSNELSAKASVTEEAVTTQPQPEAQTKQKEEPHPKPDLSITSKPPNSNYVLHMLCHRNKINPDKMFEELTNQTGLSTEFTIKLELNFLDLNVCTIGSGPTPKEAKSAASKKALIQIAHHSRLSEPTFALETYGVTEDELTAFCKSIKCQIHSSSDWTNQTDGLTAKANEEIAVQTKQKEETIPNPSTTPKSAKDFNYIRALHDLCHLNKLHPLGLFKDLANQTGVTTELQLNYLGLQVHTVGRGLTQKEARGEACKQALICIAHHSRLSEPKFPLNLYGLTEDELTRYDKSIDSLVHNPTNGLSAEANATKEAANLAVQTKQKEPQPKPNSSVTFKPGNDFNYIGAVYNFCFRRKDEASFIWRELTDQSSISSIETKFIYVLQINYLDVEVQAFGSGTSRTKAKMEACKAALIKIVYCLSDPAFLCDTSDVWAVTDDDLDDYEKCLKKKGLIGKQTDDSIAKAVLSLLTQTEEAHPAVQTKPKAEPLNDAKASINLTPLMASVSLDWRDDQKLNALGTTNCKPDSNGEVLFAKALSTTNGFQEPAGVQQAAKVKKEPDTGEKVDLNWTSIVGQLNIPMKIRKQESSSKQDSTSTQMYELKDKIEQMNLNEMASELSKLKNANGPSDGNWEAVEDAVAYLKQSQIVQEAVVYLKKNQDAFQELLELQEENATMSYKALIRIFLKLMPQRKLKYEFRVSDRAEFGIGYLLYDHQFLQIVFVPCEQASPLDLIAALEEACAKKMFYIIKLNYSN